jgi:hypothetical protein
MGNFAGVCPRDDNNTCLAGDWYQRLNAELIQAGHAQAAYVDDGTPASTANILAALRDQSVELVLYFGHGTADEWKRKTKVTVDRTNVGAANGKAVVSVACKTARSLGPDAVNNGGISAWLGFTIAVPVIPPYSGFDPIGDAIVKGLAKLASGTMASARTALESELRRVCADYDTGGRFHSHPDALMGYFAAGWLADNISLSGTTTLLPLSSPSSSQPRRPGSGRQPSSSVIIVRQGATKPDASKPETFKRIEIGPGPDTATITIGPDGEIRLPDGEVLEIDSDTMVFIGAPTWFPASWPAKTEDD